MKSKISFCNLTVIKKDITRFWPLWVMELILLQLFGNIALYLRLTDIFHTSHMTADDHLLDAQNTMSQMLRGSCNTFLIAALAIVGAVLVFGYLSQKVSAYAVHSLPLSRETLFYSHFAAGFLMIVTPFVLTYLVSGVLSVFYGLGMGKAILGILLQTIIIFFFFYSLSCLVVMISGNGIMSVLIYGVLNVLAFGYTVLLRAVMTVACFGMQSLEIFNRPTGFVKFLTPLYQFSSAVKNMVGYSLVRTISSGYIDRYQNSGVALREFPLEGLGKCAVYLLPALLFCAAAWFLYRMRPLENTGDTMAFSWCKVVFRIVFSTCGSMVFVIIFWFIGNDTLGSRIRYQSAFFLQVVLLMLGGAVCYLISEMLLEKSFQIWKKVSYCQMGIICVAMALLLVIANQTFQKNSVVAANDVKEAEISLGGVTYHYQSGEVPDELGKLQQKIIRAGRREKICYEWPEDSFVADFEFKYTTKSGKEVSRTYDLTMDENRELFAEMQDFFNGQDNQADKLFAKKYSAKNLDSFLTVKDEWEADEDANAATDWTQEEKGKIFDAIVADLNQGNLVAVNWERYRDWETKSDYSDDYTYVNCHFSVDEAYFESLYETFFIDEKCINIRKVLTELNVDF